MKLSLIAFTSRGAALGESICQRLIQSGHECQGFLKMKNRPPESRLSPVNIPCSQWAGEMFHQVQGLIFIGACGIAVRAIAPWVADKSADPAVVAVDESGRFSIALLSGHLGGANQLARQVAGITGGIPVITTATDLRGVFSVDSWAKSQGLAIGSLSAAKAVSAALLAGETVGFRSDFPVLSPLPSGLVESKNGPLGIHITLRREEAPFGQTLTLVPRAVTLGIGCRRGTQASAIERLAAQALEEAGISWLCVEKVCSIAQKADEGGILEFCGRRNLPFSTFSAAELMALKGDFTPSAFVEKTVGADNVCERAAVKGSGGRLFIQKRSCDGVTVAAAIRDIQITFEE